MEKIVKCRRWVLAFLALGVGTFLSASSASAQISINEKTTPAGNLSQFSYSFTDTGQVGIIAVSILVSTPVTNVLAPTGWIGNTTPFGDSTYVNWEVTDQTYEVQPLATASGFSFYSTPNVGTVNYTAFDENANNYNGTTTGPVAAASTAPEPSSMISLALGLPVLVLIALMIRQRSKNRAGAA